MNIAVGAAKGLSFFHEQKKPFIYGDFKASIKHLVRLETCRRQQLSHCCCMSRIRIKISKRGTWSDLSFGERLAVQPKILQTIVLETAYKTM
ncbi:hypothetical protein PIB30_073487 [Stylosanthes scabra]|uniref:Protein kinase domain-containing protein n=1 Tax=Stylosanthes scabra TaxID=79078 RepID=A0ABU6ZN53_9FABA|nr:hypothetical protein [Stylosanthes scabra]